MIHREAEEVAVGLRSDRRHPPGIRQQTDLAEVRSVRQRSRDFAVRHHDIDYAFLNEVHFRADSTLFNDDITCKFSGFAWVLSERRATRAKTIENTSGDKAMIDTWLEDFVSEFRDDIRDKIRIGVGEEGHGRHQWPAVVVYHILQERGFYKYYVLLRNNVLRMFLR